MEKTYISNIKLVNFMSFVGVYETELTPYTSIMCCYERGRHDLVAALMFVLNAPLREIGCADPQNLYHSAFSSESEFPEVSVTAQFKSADDDNLRPITLARVIFEREAFYIDDSEVTHEEYEELLTSMNYFGPPGTNMFYVDHSAFLDVLNDYEGLENLVTSFLGADSSVSEINVLKAKLAHFETCEESLLEKRHLSSLGNHRLIKQTVDSFDTLRKTRASLSKSLMSLSSDSTPDISDDENAADEEEEMEVEVTDEILTSGQCLQRDYELTKTVSDLRCRQAHFTSALVHKAIKLKKKFRSEHHSQNIFTHLKAEQLHQMEEQLSAPAKIGEIVKQIDEISTRIAEVLCRLDEVSDESFAVQTSHGRLMSYLKAGSLEWVIRATLGPQLSAAHLTKNSETAVAILKSMQEKSHGTRQTFLPLDCVSPKIQDILFINGENGIALETVANLQAFFCKLQQMSVLEDAPILVEKGGLPTSIQIDSGLTIFLETGEWVSSDGLFGRVCRQTAIPCNPKKLRTELMNLRIEESSLFDQLRRLYQEQYFSRCEEIGVESDLAVLRGEIRQPRVIPDSPDLEISAIYDDYADIFAEYSRRISPVSFDELFPTSPTSTRDEAILLAEFEDISKQAEENLKEVEESIQSLKLIREVETKNVINSLFSSKQSPVREKLVIASEPRADIAALSYELQINKLKKCIREDDVETFQGNSGLREEIAEQLSSELKRAKSDVHNASLELNQVVSCRLRLLLQAVDFCNDFFRIHGQGIMGESIAELKLILEEENPLRMQVTSWNRTMEFEACNSFIRAFCTLFLVVAIACLKGRPFLMIDDFEKFFPMNNEDVASALSNDISCDDRRNLCLKVGDFLKHILKKEQEQTSQPGALGLRQILLFTSGDICESGISQVVLYKAIPEINNEDSSIEPISKLCNFNVDGA